MKKTSWVRSVFESRETFEEVRGVQSPPGEGKLGLKNGGMKPRRMTFSEMHVRRKKSEKFRPVM